MTTLESFRALRRANPRSRADFADSVEACAESVRMRVRAAATVADEPRRPAIRATPISLF